MVKNTKQSWKGCEYGVKCFGGLTDYCTCTNEHILDFGSFQKILLRRRDHSFVDSAVLFKHTYMSLEDRMNAEKSKTLEETLQREMDKKLSICRDCRFYEPKAKSKQLKLDKK